MQAPAPIQVPLNLIRQHETNDSTASKVPALRPTLESVDAFQPDAGPNRMTLMHRNSWPWGRTLDPFDSLDSGPGSETNAANPSKVLALGAGFTFIRSHSMQTPRRGLGG